MSPNHSFLLPFKSLKIKGHCTLKLFVDVLDFVIISYYNHYIDYYYEFSRGPG